MILILIYCMMYSETVLFAIVEVAGKSENGAGDSDLRA
jgi:hypothetical protein